MRLTILERIKLISILPNQGSYRTAKIIRDLRSDLAFSEEEVLNAQIIEHGEQINWNGNKDPQKDIPIGPVAKEVIQNTLQNLIPEMVEFSFVRLYDSMNVTIPPAVVERLRQKLIMLDESGMLSLGDTELYERFVLTPIPAQSNGQ